jgi:hypothetical protein
LHELAHIYNGDVGKTYVTIAVWIAVFGTGIGSGLALLPFAPLAGTGQFFVDATIRNLIILLSGLAVLRSREYYADVKASVWDGTLSGVDGVLRRLPTSPDAGWRRYFHFHPTAVRRGQILADPSRLFQPGFWDAFGVGIAARIAIVEVASTGMPFAANSRWIFFAYVVASHSLLPLVIFSFAAGALGIGVWRGAFSALVKGEDPYRKTGFLAVALMSGYLSAIGFDTLSGFITATYLPVHIPILTHYALQACIGLVLLVGAVLTFRWIAANASAWLEVVLRRRSPRGLMITSVAAAVFFVSGSFLAGTIIAGILLIMSMQGQGPGSGLPFNIFYVILFGTYTLLAVTVAWSFALSAWFWRRRGPSASVAGWVFLDDSRFRIRDHCCRVVPLC